jgi:hypothetical protein
MSSNVLINNNSFWSKMKQEVKTIFGDQTFDKRHNFNITLLSAICFVLT